jgi:type II secretory pathway component PulC
MYRRVLIAAFLTAAAFFIAHIINLIAAHALIRSVVLRQAPAQTATHPAPGINRLRLTEEIMASGVFGAPDPAVEMEPLRTGSQGASNEADALSSITPPIEAAKKIKLVGIVAGEGEVSMAVVEEISTKKQTLYRLHDAIANVGRIAKIRKDAILIRQGLQRERLELEYAAPVVPANAPTTTTPAPAALASP